MGWTTPKNWLANTVLRAAEMQTYVSQNTLFLYERPSVKALKADSSSIASDTWTSISLTGVDEWDTNSLHETVTYPKRITIPSGLAGRWRFDILARWEGVDGTDQSRAARLRINDTTNTQTLISGTPTYPSDFIQSATTVVRLEAGDYVEVQVYQIHSTPATHTLQRIEVTATWEGN